MRQVKTQRKNGHYRYPDGVWRRAGGRVAPLISVAYGRRAATFVAFLKNPSLGSANASHRGDTMYNSTVYLPQATYSPSYTVPPLSFSPARSVRQSVSQSPMAIMGKSRKSGVDAVRLWTRVTSVAILIRFIQPSSPPESGWPALYRSVRDADVTKVDDCREDIDTLLVFVRL